MSDEREISVYLTPQLIPPHGLAGSTAVVIDVLRATTSMIFALAAGARAIIPCLEIDHARDFARSSEAKCALAGERDGTRIPGFHFGNSPGEFKASNMRDATVVMTTTNGTRAVHACLSANRVLIGAFVNYSAVCEQLANDPYPLAIVCAGSAGKPSFEDTLFAGALIDYLCESGNVVLDDAARLAWDSFENQGTILGGAFEVSTAGEQLLKLGLHTDLRDAAQVDRFAVAAEVRRDPVRVELCAAGIKRCYWPHK